jgi:hypothetical protein
LQDGRKPSRLHQNARFPAGQPAIQRKPPNFVPPFFKPTLEGYPMTFAPRRNRLAVQIAAAFGTVPMALLLALPSAALGQTAPAPKPDSGEIQSVTVTANRRAEDQQKVSVSVTAVTGATLAERNVTDLSQMESLSAGFTFGRSGVDARPAIRGVRTENVAVNADTSIGYFVDGVYRSRATRYAVRPQHLRRQRGHHHGRTRTQSHGDGRWLGAGQLWQEAL